MKNVVIIAAGGNSVRFGDDLPKQFQQINGKSILERAILPFVNCEKIDHVLVVVPEKYFELGEKIVEKIGDRKILPLVVGGRDRHLSVQNGLLNIKEMNVKNVLIHDAARIFVSQNLILELIDEMENEIAVVPAIKSVDALKEIQGDFVKNELERDDVRLIQTPQIFDFQKMMRFCENLPDEKFVDDAMIFRKFGGKVKIIEGEENNFKITTKCDFERARGMIGKEFRIGHGIDVHAFDLSRLGKFEIKIGAVAFESPHPILAHSDGDVAIHAVIDALLGAAGLGDIGEMFPDDDDQWKNADSADLLKIVVNGLAAGDYEINNVDLSIICQEPRISPRKEEIREKLSLIMGVSKERVNVKATTTEKLGFIGRKEALGAESVCSIFKK